MKLWGRAGGARERADSECDRDRISAMSKPNSARIPGISRSRASSCGKRAAYPT